MSASRERRFDVIVAGGGIVGAIAACALIRCAGATAARVALVAERFAIPTSSDWDLRVYALSRASQRLLILCDAWQRLPPDRRLAYGAMQIVDNAGLGGDAALRFDSAEIGEPDLGCIVEGRALQRVCLDAAIRAGVQLIESRIDSLSVDAGGPAVRLADGRELRANLLIGADGARSAVRGMLDIRTAGHSYDQDALVAHVRTSMPHGETAYQRFLPGGPLALLPLPDGRSSLVWSTSRAEARHLQLLEPAQFNAALTAASGRMLGTCELSTAVQSFPLQLQYALEYVRPGAVLLGDAAHVVHPLAGQGLNLGLLDCAALVQVLRDTPSTAEWGDRRVLRRYERWRRTENLLFAASLDALERVFSATGTLTSGARGIGLGLVERLPALKRQFALRALGLAGDLPEILRQPG